MSGGRKQRIQIARAVYQDADVYLLDDPFSAVDAHTGSHLIKNCLMQLLKDKTILYVTHQVEFLPAAHLILVMENGRISQAGKFKELLHQNRGFKVVLTLDLDEIMFQQQHMLTTSMAMDDTLMKNESSSNLIKRSSSPSGLFANSNFDNGKKEHFSWIHNPRCLIRK